MAAKEGPCEMCGVMGWDQFILTCEKCGTRKHQYCTKVLLMEAPDNWTCEDCHLSVKGIPVISNQPKDSPGAKEVEDNKRGNDTTRTLDTVKRKKVKYLPLEDVLKMPLGEREGSQFQTRRKDNPLMRQTNKGWSPLQAKDLVRVPTQHVTEERPHKINPALIGEVPTLQKEASKKMIPTTPRARGGFPGGNLSTAATDKGDLQKKDALLGAITSADIYRPHFPSEQVTWTGRFKFPDDTSADRCGDLVFDAVSPGRVSRNAFKRSSNLPPDLHMELIPLKQLVTNLFPNSNPDLRDIGIYFATKDASDRSFQTYKNLVEYLLSKEFALRCCLDGAELFIFMSNILNSDSQLLVTSGLTNKYFLWGVYCSTRSRGDGSISESTLHEDENENRLRRDISSAEPIIEGCDRMKETVPVSEPSPVEKAGDVLVYSEGLTENVTVKGQQLPTAIQEPRPKPPSDMLMSEQLTNLKNRVMLDTSSARRSEKGIAGARGFIKKVKVEGQAHPTAIQEPIPKPPSDMLLSEQSTNLKNWVTLNTSSAWRSEKGTAGAGGIISTSSGKWVYGFVINLGKCEKQEADLWSLLQGLLLLWERGYRAVNVKSDSSALSLLNKVPSPGDPNSQFIIGCRDILVRDWKCVWGHINVEENVAAHQLADLFESYAHGPTFLQAPPPELARFF